MSIIIPLVMIILLAAIWIANKINRKKELEREYEERLMQRQSRKEPHYYCVDFTDYTKYQWWN